MSTRKLLVVSDTHFFNPQYYQHVVCGGREVDAPSRLSTDTALGDRKANPFHALVLLARDKTICADALVCCGDLTLCADPTAMNLGWLQLNKLATELGVGEPIVTAGNHDLDSRFKTSVTSPQRMLRYLDPPFPTGDASAAASYWANGYCILDPLPDLRIVLVNSCSLHGYRTETDRQSDHGSIPEELFEQLPKELAMRGKAKLNLLICHHHPTDINLPAEDKSVISNGAQLVDLLTACSPPSWLIIHGHRHLPSVRYAGPDQNSPVVFSAGSLAVNLHLRLQGRAANQFYLLELSDVDDGIRGQYEAWTWDQHEGEWRKGQDFPALPANGGFGYRPDAVTAANTISGMIPPREDGSVSWSYIEKQHPDFKFMLPQQRLDILRCLKANHMIDWESDTGRVEVNAQLLRLGRQ